MALAREQLDLSMRLYSKHHVPSMPFASRDDPIRGEIARLTGIFYRRVGLGESVEVVYAEMCEQAKAAAREFAQRQEQIYGQHDKKDWRAGLAGYYSEDEAETKIRHAATMALMCIAENVEPVQEEA